MSGGALVCWVEEKKDRRVFFCEYWDTLCTLPFPRLTDDDDDGDGDDDTDAEDCATLKLFFASCSLSLTS